MSNWKVSKEAVEVFEHPNADKLQIVRAGEFQLVSGKGVYKTGDVVIVVPDKSVLSNGEMIAEYQKYLSGPKKNRVKQVQIRGEISQGIAFPVSEVVRTHGERVADLIAAAPLGEDISELMGITKYEPPIPAGLSGKAAGIGPLGKKYDINHDIYQHDCYAWGAFSDEFDPEEEVTLTEKLHGSLCSYTAVFEDGELTNEVVSSKGQLKKGLKLLEDEENLYWKAVRNSNFQELATQLLSERPQTDNAIITFSAELLPAQKGFSYGFTPDEPVALIFDVEVDGRHVSKDQVTGEIREMWVPVLYEGPLKDVDLYELAKGKETVSGKELHIREGICVTPTTPRLSTMGNFNLVLKVINPKYAEKETGEEIN